MLQKKYRLILFYFDEIDVHRAILKTILYIPYLMTTRNRIRVSVRISDRSRVRLRDRVRVRVRVWLGLGLLGLRLGRGLEFGLLFANIPCYSSFTTLFCIFSF